MVSCECLQLCCTLLVKEGPDEVAKDADLKLEEKSPVLLLDYSRSTNFALV